MAATFGAGNTSVGSNSLEETLLRQAHRFSFFQAMRLLLMLAGMGGETGEPQQVRVRPKLAMSFPSADVAGIETTPEGYLLEAAFLGLYGQASPLPTFYTEHLLDEFAGAAAAVRDLLDVLNHQVYSLFYECRSKYWLGLLVAGRGAGGGDAERGGQEGEGEPEARWEKIPEIPGGKSERSVKLLLSLMGLGDVGRCGDDLDPGELPKYAGLFVEHPRSALGLKTLIADALKLPVTVVQGVERRAPIPPEQRIRLGVANSTLGDDAVIGRELREINSRFRLVLGPLDRETFSAHLPGNPGRRRLDALVLSYLTDPLLWDLELVLIAGAAPAAAVGREAGGRLGWDSWLLPDGALERSAVFPGAASAATSSRYQAVSERR